MCSDGFPEEIHEIIQNHLDSQDEGYGSPTVSSIENLLKAKLKVKQWGKNSYLMPFQDGVFNFKTNKFEAHSPANRLSWQLPRKYKQQNQSDDWGAIRKFLNEFQDGNQKKIHELCCIAAAGLRGMTHLHIFAFLVGDGGTGKSSFLNLIKAVCGEENFWTGQIQDMNDKHDMVELKDKRFAIHDDQDPVTARQLGNFKIATGGGTLSGRSLYKGKIQFPSTAIHLITSNYDTFVGMESLADWIERRCRIFSCHSKPTDVENLEKKFASEIETFTQFLLSIPEKQIENTLKWKPQECTMSADLWKTRLSESLAAWADANLIFEQSCRPLQIGNNCDEWKDSMYNPSESTAFGSYYNFGRKGGYKSLLNSSNFSKFLYGIFQQLGWGVPEKSRCGPGGTIAFQKVRLRRLGEDSPTILESLRERESQSTEDYLKGFEDLEPLPSKFFEDLEYLIQNHEHLKPLPSKGFEDIEDFCAFPKVLYTENLSDETEVKTSEPNQPSVNTLVESDRKKELVRETTALAKILMEHKGVTEEAIKKTLQQWYKVNHRSRMSVEQLTDLKSAMTKWIETLPIPMGQWKGKEFMVDKSQVRKSRKMKCDSYEAIDEPVVFPGGECMVRIGFGMSQYNVPCTALTLIS